MAGRNYSQENRQARWASLFVFVLFCFFSFNLERQLFCSSTRLCARAVHFAIICQVSKSCSHSFHPISDKLYGKYDNGGGGGVGAIPFGLSAKFKNKYNDTLNIGNLMPWRKSPSSAVVRYILCFPGNHRWN